MLFHIFHKWEYQETKTISFRWRHTQWGRPIGDWIEGLRVVQNKKCTKCGKIEEVVISDTRPDY